MGLPLVNETGIIDEPDDTIQPLDELFLEKGKLLIDVEIKEKDSCLYDGIFTTFTLSLSLSSSFFSSFKALGCSFSRHRDIELPANHLRLWATMSDKMVLKIDDKEMRDIEPVEYI